MEKNVLVTEIYCTSSGFLYFLHELLMSLLSIFIYASLVF